MVRLFLAGDLASGVLCVADRTLDPAFGLIGLAFGFSARIAHSFAGLFLDLTGDFLHASGNTILIHRQSLCMIYSHWKHGNSFNSSSPEIRVSPIKQNAPEKLGGVPLF
jgi:hypothetical protein